VHRRLIADVDGASPPPSA